MNEVKECIERLECIYDETFTQIKKKQAALDDVASVPGMDPVIDTLTKDLCRLRGVTSSITNGIQELQSKITMANRRDMPLETLDLSEPMYAYECEESDSNFMLTSRPRRILESIVTTVKGEATPNMTTMMFGPLGNPTELFGWEIVGLYNMLVSCPKALSPHVSEYEHLINRWESGGAGIWTNQPASFHDGLYSALRQVLPPEDTTPHPPEKVPRDFFAYPQWVDFRKTYNPQFDFRTSKFQKRLQKILEDLNKASSEKKRKRTDNNENRSSFLRLDLACDISKDLRHDVHCCLRSAEVSVIEKRVNRKTHWGIDLSDLAPRMVGALKNVMKSYIRSQEGCCALSADKLDFIRKDLETWEGLMGDTAFRHHVSQYTLRPPYHPDDAPNCAIARVSSMGFFKS